MIDISVTGLVKSFDLEKKILDGLTFQVDSGERVGLLGKNGAGKTTLFRIRLLAGCTPSETRWTPWPGGWRQGTATNVSSGATAT